jgi:NAD(P)-dependent dehydrogenase (short-subunit alcohol dehydrogenase family)
VALLDRALGGALEDLATELGAGALAVRCDVRDAAQVRDAVGRAAKALGPADVVVNSAGVSSDDLAVDLSEETWDRVVDTNLKGTFLVAQACAPPMLERGWGRVVNLASIFSLVGFPGRAAYGASKGAIASLTRQLAVEWAARGVTVNAVAPGPIETPMFAERLRDPDYRAATLGATPNGRIGQPEDVAAVIAFLAGEEALHVTGQVIVVDGGFTSR